MTIKQNLVNGKGETFTLNIEFKDSTGAAVDLTGHGVDFVLKKAGTGTVISTTAASVDANGNIRIKVTDEETDTWPVGKSAYVVIHTNPDGDEKWLMYGALTVNSGVDV